MARTREAAPRTRTARTTAPPLEPAAPEGHLVTTEDLQRLHDYLMSRPCNETLELVVLVRQVAATEAVSV